MINANLQNKSQKKEPRISMIAAIARNSRVIGEESGGIPWKISEDFKHFKNTTIGHPIIMGRKTFETLPGILPGRTNVVITKNKQYDAPKDVIVASSVEEALIEAKKLNGEEIFIMGGGQIYEEAIKYADRLYLTLVKKDISDGIKFPEYKDLFPRQISSRKSSGDNYEYEFVILEK